MDKENENKSNIKFDKNNDFVKHLLKLSAYVETWPLWEQNILGSEPEDVYQKNKDCDKTNLGEIKIDMTNRELNKKTSHCDITLERGDITKFDIDAIVNAAHDELTGGGGVDGAIHKAAGQKLLGECLNLYGCPEGEARITGAYNMLCKYIIHTVGPVWTYNSLKETYKEKLRKCYLICLEIAERQGLKSIAFPCISTGAYCFPKNIAASVAVNTIKDFFVIHNNNTYIKLVQIVCFDDENYKEYKKILF